MRGSENTPKIKVVDLMTLKTDQKFSQAVVIGCAIKPMKSN
jgi:hypothetical protein